ACRTDLGSASETHGNGPRGIWHFRLFSRDRWGYGGSRVAWEFRLRGFSPRRGLYLCARRNDLDSATETHGQAQRDISPFRLFSRDGWGRRGGWGGWRGICLSARRNDMA